MLPIKLSINNFYSHKCSEIDFTQFNSALLIGNVEGDYSRSNGSGKSSIQEAILWCLFNKARVAMMDDIVLWGETKCHVIFDFSHNSSIYRVRRNRNRSSSTSSVEFYVQDAFGDWKNISGSTAGDTNAKIESTIKLDYKTFVNSIYFRQNDISEFAQADAASKKEILKNIVDISKWDLYEKEAKKRHKDLSTECISLSTSISLYDQTISDISSMELELSSSKQQMSIYQSSYSKIENEIDVMTNKYAEIKASIDTDSWDRITAENEKIKREAKDLKDRLDNVSNNLKNQVGKVDLINKQIDELSIKSNFDSNINIDDAESEVESLVNEKMKCSTIISAEKSVIKSLQGLKILEDRCYACNQDIQRAMSDRMKNERHEKILAANEKIKQAEDKFNHIEEKILSTKKAIASYRLATEARSKLEILKSQHELFSSSINTLELDKESLRTRIFNLKNSFMQNMQLLESLKNNDFKEMHDKIAALKAQRTDISLKVNELGVAIGSLEAKIQMHKDTLITLGSDRKKLLDKQKQISVLDKIIKLFGKNGIQTILLNALIQDLENSANTILSSICNEPSVIVLETQRAGSDGSTVVETLDLKIRKDGMLQHFASLSGGEQFRISLALRIALSEVSSRHGGSSLEFLLLDEINSPLDKYGTETLFVNVIKSLESKYKMLVITHDEMLKEKFDNVIDVSKVNGESSAIFTSK